MSGKHWLERDPKDSPGLQRIREAQQAAAAAKAQIEQQAREAEIASREEKRKMSETIQALELAKRRIKQFVPYLEEIKDFANETNTFPLPHPFPRDQYSITSTALIEKATIQLKDDGTHAYALLSYGYPGCIEVSGKVDYGDYTNDYSAVYPTIVHVGIELRSDRIHGEEILKRDLVEIPEVKDRYEGRGWVYGHPEEIRGVDRYVPLPATEPEIKQVLAEAFHDPIYLGAKLPPFLQEVTSQPEPQANTGIADLVKGLLGLK